MRGSVVHGERTEEFSRIRTGVLISKPSGCGAQIGGFIAKAEDALPTTESYQEARESLRLDYGKTTEPLAYPEDGKKMYVVRFNASNDFHANERVPYNKELDSSVDTGMDAPCTGNGYLGGKDSLIAEYEARRNNIRDGAIFIINDQGEEELYAVYNDKGYFEELYK